MISKIRNILRRKPVAQEDITEEKRAANSTEIMVDALKTLNCHPNIDTTEQKDHVIYFKYQGMNFRAFTFAEEGNNNCNLDYHAGMYKFERFEHLRQVCNNANTSVLPIHYYFTPNTQDNCYNLYATATITDVYSIPDLPECLTKMLEMFFISQRNFESAMNKKQQDNADNEEDLFMSQREAQLAQDMEVALTSQNKPQTFTQQHLLTDFLESVYQIQSAGIESVGITTERQSELIKDTLRIHTLPLLAPLFSNLDKPENIEIKAKTASVTVNFIDNTGDTHNILILMRVESEEQKTIYARLSAMRNGDRISIDNIWGSTRNMPKASTWLLAVDKTTEANHHAEVRYKWEEAKRKLDQGETLTDEEIFLCRIASFPLLSDSAYTGRKLLNQKRYFEAMRHFECINEYLERHFHDDFWDDALREHFAHNNYYLGICHLETGDPMKGIIFMEKACLIYPCPTHQIGHIKALFRAGDFRLLHVIRTRIDELEEYANNLKEDETLPEPLLELYDFLQRAFVTALILNNKHNDAIARLNIIIANGPENTRHWAEQKLKEITKKQQK